MALLRGVAQETYHLAHHAKLYAPRLDGEQNGTGDEDGYEYVGPQHIVDLADSGVEPTVGCKDLCHLLL